MSGPSGPLRLARGKKIATGLYSNGRGSRCPRPLQTTERDRECVMGGTLRDRFAPRATRGPPYAVSLVLRRSVDFKLRERGNTDDSR